MLSIGRHFYYRAKLSFYEWQTRRLFYAHAEFAKQDRALLRAYRFINPYRLSRDFLLSRGAEDPHQYGETPVKSYFQMAEACGLTSQDRVLELGCGRGRGVFFLASFYGCQVHGIDWNPQFVAIAQSIQASTQASRISFSCEDMFLTDLRQASFIYLYGTCLSDACIDKMLFSLERAAPGTKIVTVSYSLERPDLFTLEKKLLLRFPWGKAEAYLHIRRQINLKYLNIFN